MSEAVQPLLKVRDLSKHFPVFSKGFFRKQIGVVKASAARAPQLCHGAFMTCPPEA